MLTLEEVAEDMEELLLEEVPPLGMFLDCKLNRFLPSTRLNRSQREASRKLKGLLEMTLTMTQPQDPWRV